MENKNYLIIGGTSGIDKKIVESLSASGNRIYVASRSGEPSDSMINVSHFQLDVTKEGNFPTDVLPESLQGLVYCPGTIRLQPFKRLTTDDFANDFNINLLGAVRSIKTYLPFVQKSPIGGTIILFSTVAVKIGMAYHTSISSAKGAIEGFARSLAAEFAPNIRVNVIAPSLTDTSLSHQLLSTEQKRDNSAQRHPLKRIGRPEEIAQLATFLLSENGSWITGQTIRVDGGISSVKML
jgi:NAD(P)-dependent dehydrogenase (short-subunit alcohol dehydrogenase family)